MKILHYSLGFPPYRSGGMTTFCMDLMEQQIKDGNQVALLWPGRMKFTSKKVKMKKSIYQKDDIKILNFEIINPLPIPYDEGIDSVNNFIDDTEYESYIKLLTEMKPDVIHIHTLMGLHKFFLEQAKRLGIQLVFTTHDFFPICPKVTLMKNNKICENFYNCNECNGTALSINKIKLLQSNTYKNLKNSLFVKYLRKRHRNTFFNDQIKQVKEMQDYRKLKNYYFSMLKLMDAIHYNSNFTKEIYEKNFKFSNSHIISITHKNIKDNKKIKNYEHNYLRIRYLGTSNSFKGFYILKEACDKLHNEGFPFHLDVHFNIKEEYINVNPKYSYSDLENIFNKTDILICPSLCETFNYTVLESLSFGCPVIITDKVGAKDILENDCGFIIEDINSDKLYEILRNLTKEKLYEMNQNIIENQKIMTIEEMAEQINVSCYIKR